MNIREQLGELGKLIELTGANSVDGALATVECWRFNEENRKQLEERWVAESKQAFETLSDYIRMMPPAYSHALLTVLHENSLLTAEVIRLRSKTTS
jgi:hypothetical protein